MRPSGSHGGGLGVGKSELLFNVRSLYAWRTSTKSGQNSVESTSRLLVSRPMLADRIVELRRGPNDPGPPGSIPFKVAVAWVRTMSSTNVLEAFVQCSKLSNPPGP